MALLEVHDLSTSFHLRSGVVRAVDGVSLEVERGQTVGIVGESGSGKSVTCYSIMRLVQEPGRIDRGAVFFDGEDLCKASAKRMREIRGGRIAMIFQDPMTSLNPFLRVSTQMVESLLLHSDLDRKAALHQAIQGLEEVGIADAEKRIHGYPHEFSGGMRQRVMIASALLTKPDLLIADEPVSALDVSIQSQILNLLRKLRDEMGLTMIFVSHDLSVVRYIADRIAVMYLGKIIELGESETIVDDPLHIYTRALMSAIPMPDPRLERSRQRVILEGDPPSPLNPPSGCSFWPRSPIPHDERMKTVEPELVEIYPGHFARNCPFCLQGTVDSPAGARPPAEADAAS